MFSDDASAAGSDRWESSVTSDGQCRAVAEYDNKRSIVSSTSEDGANVTITTEPTTYCTYVAIHNAPQQRASAGS
jgi:hypothetical protein